jgi:hypothetical protein
MELPLFCVVVKSGSLINLKEGVRKMFRSKMGSVSEKFRMLHKKELCDSYWTSFLCF